jgi:hypothetical protein
MGIKRKKIKEPTDYMRNHYRNLFLRNQSKWIRRSKLETSHLGIAFVFEGNDAILIGSVTSEEVLLHLTESDEYMITHIDEVSRTILG